MQHNLIYKYFKKPKAYAQAIGLEKSNLVGAKIFLDFLICMWRYGFLPQDYIKGLEPEERDAANVLLSEE